MIIEKSKYYENMSDINIKNDMIIKVILVIC
jgi:hypothetical protein